MSKNEAESDRQSRENELREEYAEDLDFLHYFAPGKLGFHETVDRAKVAIEYIDQFLLSHAGLILNKEHFQRFWNLTKKMNDVVDEMCDLHVANIKTTEAGDASPQPSEEEWRPDPFDGPEE